MPLEMQGRAPSHLLPIGQTSLASPPSSTPTREGRRSRQETPVANPYPAWRSLDISVARNRRAPARSHAFVCDRTPADRSLEIPSRPGRFLPRAAPCEGIRIHRREGQSRNRGHHPRVMRGPACPVACPRPRRPSHPPPPPRYRFPPPRSPRHPRSALRQLCPDSSMELCLQVRSVGRVKYVPQDCRYVRFERV